MLEAFIRSVERSGVWTIQPSIFPGNRVSIELHAEFEFRSVGRRERIAMMTYGPLAGSGATQS